MKARDGFSLAELAVAVVLAGLVGAAFAGTLAGGERLARDLGGRLAVAEAVRTTRLVLAGELRAVESAEDLRAVGPDSLALRAFRGVAIVCSLAGEEVLVRYRGVREPEPEKDSVVVAAGAVASVAALAGSVEAAGCSPRAGETVHRWTLAVQPTVGSLLLLFESGSYHLASDALRYRRGAGGRQPLTANLLVDRVSAFHALDPGGAGAAHPTDVAAIEAVLGAWTPGRTTSAGADLRPMHVRWNLLNAWLDSTAGARGEL